MKKYSLFLAVICIFCLSATCYGMVVFDNTFTRGTGAPVPDVFQFKAANGPATIRLTNGNLENSSVERVSSSTVTVNGEILFGPSNFNQNVEFLEEKIKLNAVNSIEVALKGTPGGQVIIQITQDPLRITILTPNAALAGETVMITFTGDVDETPLQVVFSSQIINTTPVSGRTDVVTFQVPAGASSGPLYLQQGERVSNAVYFYVSNISVVTPVPEDIVLDEIGKEIAVNLLLIFLKEEFYSDEEAQRVAGLNGAVIVGQIPPLRAYQVKLQTRSLAELWAAVAIYEANPAVDFAVPDQKLPCLSVNWDPCWGDQRLSNNVEQGATLYSKYVHPSEAGKITPAPVTIGVLESSGIDWNIADFDRREALRNDDGSLAIAIFSSRPGNYFAEWCKGDCCSYGKHGTIVTGIIAAELGDGDYEATGKNSGLLQALQDDNGRPAHGGFEILVEGRDIARDDPVQFFHGLLQTTINMCNEGAKVINWSWGWYEQESEDVDNNFICTGPLDKHCCAMADNDFFDKAKKAIEFTLKTIDLFYEQVVVVAAAGNFNNLCDVDEKSSIIPAGLAGANNIDSLIVVGAHGWPYQWPSGEKWPHGEHWRDCEKLFFSSYGPKVDIAAAGVVKGSDGRAEAGTSYAAPLVTATIAAMQSINPNLSPGQIRHLLRISALPIYNNEVTDSNGTPVGVFTAPMTEDEVGLYDPRLEVGMGARLNVEGAIRAAIESLFDGDGILNDGDFSGTIGDNPCMGGNTTLCDDNCPNTYNPDQADSDGDGIGDACDTDSGLIDVLTEKEKSWLTAEELGQINGMTGSELINTGLNNLTAGEVLKAKAYFKIAESIADNLASNDADTARFFYAVSRVAALAFDIQADGVDDGFLDGGDILDVFGFSEYNRDLFGEFDLIFPDPLLSSTPRGVDLQDFAYDIVRPELKGAITTLDMISTAFNTTWVEPVGSTSVESDYGDVFVFMAALKSAVAGILAQYAYNLDMDIASELNDANNTHETFLSNNPFFMKLVSSGYLETAKGYVHDAATDVENAIDWILAETDNQIDDLVNLAGVLPEEIAEAKEAIDAAKQSLDGPSTMFDNGTPDDLSDDTVINMYPFFSGIDLRSLLPSFMGDQPIGFLPDTSFGGVLLQLEGQAPSVLLDDDSNGNSIADIFEEVPEWVHASWWGNSIYIWWDRVSGATEYHVYWGTESGVTTSSNSLIPTDNTVYEHTGVQPGYTYYYRVAAVTALGESPLSEGVHARNEFVTIDGHVYEEGSNNPIPGARIATSLDGMQIWTDSTGHFFLQTYTPDNYSNTPYTITISAAGYQTFSDTHTWGDHPSGQAFYLSLLSPTVSVSPSQGPIGTLFSEPGFGFTPNSTVTLHFLGPDGSHYDDQIEDSDPLGHYKHYYLSHEETAIGEWEYYGVDDTTGTRSSSVFYNIVP